MTQTPDIDIPVLDFSDLVSGNPETEKRFIQQLDTACRQSGLFFLTGHCVPLYQLNAVFTEAERFFALPFDNKNQVSMLNNNNHRGYRRCGPYGMDPALREARRELFEIGRELNHDHPLVLSGTPLHGPNQWPQNMSSLRRAFMAYYYSMTAVGQLIMPAFAIALGLNKTAFDSAFDNSLAHLRIIRYPGNEDESLIDSSDSITFHNGYGCFTMIAQDDRNHLEIQRRDGRWLPVPHLRNTLLVRVGDIIRRWTNDEYNPCTRYRIINRSDTYHYSAPFIFGPNHDAIIACLQQFVKLNHPPQYKPVLAGEYLLKVFNKLHRSSYNYLIQQN